MHKPHTPSPLSNPQNVVTAPRPSRRAPGPRAARPRKKKELTDRQKSIAKSAATRAEWDKRVFEWQQRLFDGAVDLDLLVEAAKYLTPTDYTDIVTERVSDKTCGYPLCDQAVADIKGRYRISRAEQKVYDVTELKRFCSSTCFAASQFFKAQLVEEPVYMRNFESMPPVEVIPTGYTLSEFRQQRVSKSAPSTTSPKTLRTNYVHTLLQRLPNMSAPTIVVKEKTIEPPTPPTPPADIGPQHDAIEGFHVQFRKDKKGRPSTMVLKERLDGSSITPEPINDTQHIESQTNEQSLGDGITHLENKLQDLVLTDHDIPIASPNGPPRHHTKGPAAPHRPPTRIFSSETVIESPLLSPPHSPLGPDTTEQTPQIWLHPKPIGKMVSLSLFGNVWTLLGRMVTDRTRGWVRGESWGPVVEDERMTIRKGIFMEKMLATYALFRREYHITVPITDDLSGLVDTLYLSETMAVPSHAEQWVLTIIFIKVLSRRLVLLAQEVENKWKDMLEPSGVSEEELNVFVQLFG
ncbi:uncharacterized protein SPPG_00483 [Spizellomyces punctatus DAOM BR117]|uniref:RNA polymerase II subunit B1 CTD phosphatase RPAP2 homolog n=1 Tax=Spizellomyces punctatus (strain DAOM BR117) TaxID=645134 RepID=A0A0L0HV80_SPIPD|nr:uncharacterized protein SPPG_00483 [Spizellomyces punctatus DAOM BR117]KND04779.1 hypothetical protein SPPG_00483 [Spizellomyces punctatus DAOM BR117]|eukprot:XP_016612818.1 hypothetical protein SPPG_00483 [Spizellomyces punctatus DAOM BR117]